MQIDTSSEDLPVVYMSRFRLTVGLAEAFGCEAVYEEREAYYLDRDIVPPRPDIYHFVTIRNSEHEISLPWRVDSPDLFNDGFRSAFVLLSQSFPALFERIEDIPILQQAYSGIIYPDTALPSVSGRSPQGD